MNLQVNSGDKHIDLRVKAVLKMPDCFTNRPLRIGDTEQLEALKALDKQAKARIFYERMTKAKHEKQARIDKELARINNLAEEELVMSAYENGGCLA